MSFVGNSTKLESNPYSWSKLGHVLYIDQPVGTGYSTASDPYPVHDMDRVTSDFHAWLQSFLTQFSHLQSKRVHLIGESYAGFYIPYFASAIIDNQDSFPLDLASLSMGDPTIGDPAAMTSVMIGQYLESQKSALQIPDDIISAFTEGSEECGFDGIAQKLNTYPPKTGPIPIPGNPDNLYTLKGADALINGDDCYPHATDADGVLYSILNETDCLGSCATFNTAIDYLYTKNNCFDQYDISNGCDKISQFPILANYFGRADVQAALNIPPPSTDSPAHYSACSNNILAALTLSETATIPTSPTFSILPSILNNGSIAVHVYSGEYDFLLNHFGTELVLQNMTWNGAQGFVEKPSKAFYSDDAMPDDSEKGEDKNVAGTWGEERGLSYHFFHGAGHSVFAKKGREMFAFVRDVVVA